MRRGHSVSFRLVGAGSDKKRRTRSIRGEAWILEAKVGDQWRRSVLSPVLHQEEQVDAARDMWRTPAGFILLKNPTRGN